MSSKSIAIKPSRFSALKISDSEDDEQPTLLKSKDKVNANNAQQSASTKKKNKKKKKAGGADADSAKGSGGNQKKGGAGDSDAQWEQWKRIDAELTADHYEKDMESAILMSKLTHEEQAAMATAASVNGHDDGKGGTQDKKKKKKGTMSLDEFNQMPAPQTKGSDSDGGEQYEILPSKEKLDTKIANPDTTFFETVSSDARSVLRKEVIQEEYRKQYSLESAQAQRNSEELLKKDQEIERLTEENTKLSTEYKQVKKRNQQLCHILAQGEMKDKQDVLLEVEQLRAVQLELTQEVQDLNSELERERSQVSTLREELAKHKNCKVGSTTR